MESACARVVSGGNCENRSVPAERAGKMKKRNKYGMTYFISDSKIDKKVKRMS
jgi:hypothetical protein